MKTLDVAFKRPRTTPAAQSDVRIVRVASSSREMDLRLKAGHFMNRRGRHISGCRSRLYCNARRTTSGGYVTVIRNVRYTQKEVGLSKLGT